MSNRALKKLNKLNSSSTELDHTGELDNTNQIRKRNTRTKSKSQALDFVDITDSESSDFYDQEINHSSTSNIFSALEDKVEHSNSGELSEQEELAEKKIELKVKKTKSKPKKKQNQKKKNNAVDELSDTEFNNILNEHGKKFVNEDKESGEKESTKTKIPKVVTSEFTKLLQVQIRLLDPMVEINQMFGKHIVQQEIKKKRLTKGGRYLLTKPRDYWQPCQRLGLSMEQYFDSNGIATPFFGFKHNDNYRKTTQKFYAAIQTHDPNFIRQLQFENPYHALVLLQLADINNSTGDVQKANECIEMGLLAIEKSFHTNFEPFNGRFRLDYRQLENRPIFLILFKHMEALTRQGCWRAAFEFAKMILSLSPNDDPLGVMFLIDRFALKAKQYQYVLDMWSAKQDINAEGVSVLEPNWLYSLALAKFRLNDTQETDEVLDALSFAIMAFPSVFLHLIEACKISISENLEPILDYSKQLSSERPVYFQDNTQLHYQCVLYVDTNAAMWKEPEVIQLVKSVVPKVLTTLENLNAFKSMDDTAFNSIKKRYQADLDQDFDSNLCRHFAVTGDTVLATTLPGPSQDLNFYSFDPYPPLDSVSLYEDFKILPPPRSNATFLKRVNRQYIRWIYYFFPSLVITKHNNESFSSVVYLTLISWWVAILGLMGVQREVKDYL